MKKIIKSKYTQLLPLTAVIFLLQKIIDRLSWKTAFLFDYSAIDKDDVFMALSIHHIMLTVFTLIIILVLHKLRHLDFRLKPKVDKIGIKYTILYCIAVLFYYILVYIIGIATNSVGVYDYELNAVNVIGTLGFQFLLTGMAEELLFRALPVICLSSVCNKNNRSINIAILFLTSLLFAIAHINFNVPFSSQWFNVLYAFINGAANGFVFLHSKSIIYPMIMHGVSNFISVGGCYLYMALSSAA